MLEIFKKTIMTFAAFTLISGACFADSSIVIKGSTTVLPVAQATLEAFMKKNPTVHMSLSGGGSPLGSAASNCRV
ncbi:MAG TPA: hypothetical protein P5040_09005, partial [Smithella sp.]|nr:hypothetical protein [Smithella sp.]